LGQTVEKALIENWRVGEGDVVKKGDVLLEITTDKATLEVESFVEGTVLTLYAGAGEEVDVEAVIAYVGDPATDHAPDAPPTPVKTEAAPSAEKPATAAPTPEPAAPAPETPAAPSAPASRLFISPRAKQLAEDERVTPFAIRGSGPNGRIVEADVAAYAERVRRLRVSPAAKQLARERGVDLLTAHGTGTSGRIMKADIARAAPLAAAGADVKTVPLAPARRIIAERMARSKREAPHFYLQVDVDMTDAVALREELKAAGAAVSFNDLIIKAVARGFEAVPAMNASWAGDCIALHRTADVALAVSIDDGLMVPVVRNVAALGLEEIAAATAELIDKARSKRLAPFEYEGGSITISNLGMFGVGNFLPIIDPGQGAILGVGQIADAPVVRDGEIAVRKMMSVTLAADHRVNDGATAAAFLQAAQAALESPREGLSGP